MAEFTEEQIQKIVKAVEQGTWHGKVFPYQEGWYNKVAAAGTNNKDFEKVDPKRIRVITHISAYNDVTSCPFIYLFHHNGQTYIPLAGTVAPLIGEVVAFNGQAILKPGDYIRVSFETCSSGDDIYAGVNGYEIML